MPKERAFNWNADERKKIESSMKRVKKYTPVNLFTIGTLNKKTTIN